MSIVNGVVHEKGENFLGMNFVSSEEITWFLTEHLHQIQLRKYLH